MRTRAIHDKFILDVTHLALSWTEENTWFKDEFFLNSSFPFDLPFDENRYFEFFQHYNLSPTDTYYQIKLEKDGKIEEAILEVEEAAEKLRITIRYGVEALPNWNKKLSELELDVVLPDGGNMRIHAESIITQTWPAVKYNFPAIHTKYYDGAAMFEDFQGVLNKRVDGVFVPNDADGGDTINRNIVYPLPYDLYVLNACFEDAGYTLHGDIQSDPDFIDAVIVPGKKVANFEGIPEPIEWLVTQDDIYDVEIIQPGLIRQYWRSEQELMMRGYFQIFGSINNEVVSLKIKHNGLVIFNYSPGMPLNFNFWRTTFDDDNLLECEVISYNITNPSSYAAIINIKTLYLTDENGDMLPFVANFSNVQLATALPDMTVGEYVKSKKKAKNYDLDLRENKEIWMNLVQNEVTQSFPVDISEYDVSRPVRKFEQSKSFLLQYEGEYEEKYVFDKIYADRTGYFINDFQKSENTSEISINFIPLPIDSLYSDGDIIKTAVQLSDDASKLQLVKYNGLVDGENWAQEMTGMKPLNLYLNYWQRWLNFIIYAVKFQFIIKDHPNLLIKLKRKSKLFAHNNFMFVFALNRKREGDIEEVEVEAYSSKV